MPRAMPMSILKAKAGGAGAANADKFKTPNKKMDKAHDDPAAAATKKWNKQDAESPSPSARSNNDATLDTICNVTADESFAAAGTGSGQGELAGQDQDQQQQQQPDKRDNNHRATTTAEASASKATTTATSTTECATDAATNGVTSGTRTMIPGIIATGTETQQPEVTPDSSTKNLCLPAVSPLSDFDDLSVDTSKHSHSRSGSTTNSAIAGLSLFHQPGAQQQQQQQVPRQVGGGKALIPPSSSSSNHNKAAASTAAPATATPTPTTTAPSPPPKLIFGKFEIDRAANNGNPILHVSDTDAYVAAIDHSIPESPTRVVLKAMTNPAAVLAELEARVGVDDKYVLPIKSVHVDKGDGHTPPGKLRYTGPTEVHHWTGMGKNLRAYMTERIKIASSSSSAHHHHHHHAHAHSNEQQQHSVAADVPNCPTFPYVLCLQSYDRTLEDVLSHDLIDFNLVRKIVKDIVVGLILLHTEERIHGDLNPRSVVRVGGGGPSGGGSWKLTDLHRSKTIGRPVPVEGAVRGSNEGYMCPEVAALLLRENDASAKNARNLSYAPDAAYDLFSLGCVMYQLIFGSALWNINKTGKIPADELLGLSKWSPLSFLEKASIRFPIDGRTENQKAALDLISKLLAPTPEDRRSNFEFGVVSVRQHEFLQKKPLDKTSLVGFKAKQDMMFLSEKERLRYDAIVRGLTLEERWELRRAKDVQLFGMFEPTQVHVPTSFVILKNKLPHPRAGSDSASSAEMTKKEAKKRLREGMRWVTSFLDLDPLVRGALEGDVPSIGHFWSKISDMFSNSGDYMYLYWIDELTGMPVLPAEDGRGGSPDYPMEITTRSDTMPKILPLMHLTMRAMALYHGVAGIARMFGCTLSTMPEELRAIAQAKVNELKQERGETPFGSLEADVDAAQACKEQFMKREDSLRARSAREFVRFLEKKEGRKVDFAGLRRYPDEDGVAIWTCMQDTAGFRAAIRKRSAERLKEERNHWVDVQEEEIDALVKSIGADSQKVSGLEKSLESTVEQLTKANNTSNSLATKVAELEKALDAAKKEVVETKKEVEEGKGKKGKWKSFRLSSDSKYGRNF